MELICLIVYWKYGFKLDLGVWFWYYFYVVLLILRLELIYYNEFFNCDNYRINLKVILFYLKENIVGKCVLVR